MKYVIGVTLQGYVEVEVEAETEKEAKKRAAEIADINDVDEITVAEMDTVEIIDTRVFSAIRTRNGDILYAVLPDTSGSDPSDIQQELLRMLPIAPHEIDSVEKIDAEVYNEWLHPTPLPGQMTLLE